MSLPGVESARRRRASHGRSAALMQPHPRLSTKPSPFSPYHEIEDAARQSYLAGDGEQYSRLPSRAMEARRRLHEKLRAGGSSTKSHSLQLQSPRADQLYSAPLKQAVGSSANTSLVCVGLSSSSHGVLEHRNEKRMSVGVARNNVKEGKLSRCTTATAMAASNYLQEECPICLECFLTGLTVISLPCSHVFHSNCLLPWLQDHSHCPCCRASIPK